MQTGKRYPHHFYWPKTRWEAFKRGLQRTVATPLVCSWGKELFLKHYENESKGVQPEKNPEHGKSFQSVYYLTNKLLIKVMLEP